MIGDRFYREPSQLVVPYDRAVLVEALVCHQRKSIEGCACGWGELGKSHAEHVATVYEETAHAEIDRLRRVERHAREVMAALEQFGAGIAGHLLDTDDNAGERLRRALNVGDGND